MPLPGGEDAEFFRIGKRSFLAVASIRSGSRPYEFATPSHVLEWADSTVHRVQSFDCTAAKQWKHFTMRGRNFLALVQGVVLPKREDDNRPSQIFVWDGERFAHFQDINSQWAHDWHAFSVDSHDFLAHVGPSVLYRFTGEKSEPYY